MTIILERVYDYLKRQRNADEYVVLTDRLWPRGIKKEALDYDEWNKTIAPSTELRRWFGHDPRRWEAFASRYEAELAGQQQELQRLRAIAHRQPLILLYAAREHTYNHPVVLKRVLESTA